MSKEDVRARIEAAFANTPAPGEEFEDISATYDDEGIVDYFRGTTWRGHRVKDLRHYSFALSFFTDKAFRYWLAAFMLAELEDPEGADVIAHGIASNFTYHGADGRLGEFTRGELEAVAEFLSECDERYSGGYEAIYQRAGATVRARIKSLYRRLFPPIDRFDPKRRLLVVVKGVRRVRLRRGLEVRIVG